MELFTIGHSNHSIEAFIELLLEHNVSALADVRSHPYSRYLPHFNSIKLKDSLKRVNIKYVFLGQELGARPKNPECYVDGKAVYEKIAATELFREGIKRVINGLKDYRISLMCAEKDPIVCHRAILVCQHLRNERNLQINHIKNNGDLESHDKLEDRLLARHGLKQLALVAAPLQLSLFSDSSQNLQPSNLPSREESIKEAYRLQSDEVAYVEKKGNEYE
ncbi:DUF488 domain-containing protein [Anabaena cylindrica FACHB-243]|uniref:DUF488 domain-containing protein n=1 Tax=Anabaena cylindrica (strain ATCC 27899 / PCC 7122) TaxID=272123 RepID=K9Z9U7_ANACC|nr:MULTISPECIES: DUF488 domain-containing protein [Anabaena]AFZ55946.1 hypothetical protein Anacy_0344 [Anabaena cylindrica PCC 7122]MBD2421367.1 DUF488 domain-containing protein [Anabaena cylindrica FACHB-243]MBY5285242.1 DUF488 domain-containing protein [Anabaena sp. CCAP 1446/1C]MBY5308585.1 DUF488 domain-containing protein [Anabaena sp. CCAP 1446/1C]MCM2406699.1 DUF488 domain-containing protein [Anabaena sp. CCAP 1446/1C]